MKINMGGINIRWILWLAVSSLLIISVTVSALTLLDKIPGKEYLFIDVLEHQDGKIISGTAYKMMIDFPIYSLENHTLRSAVPIDIDPGASAILGKGSSLSGDMGGGAASGLSLIKETPHFIGSYSGLNVSILGIVGEDIVIDLSGRQMVLEPGESWKRERTDTQQIQDSLMRVTTTLTIWNHGRVVFDDQASWKDLTKLGSISLLV
jgi:hypothetical protein